MPAGREPLHEYEGNKMIVTLDKETFDGRALELAYRYARCRCLMAAERELAARRRRRPGRRRGGALRAAGRAEDPQLADRRHARASTARARPSTRWSQRVEASLERVESLIAAA